jgi:hypothetical protein
MTTNPIGSLSTLLSNQEAIREGITKGQCHILSLGPIRDALGKRWARNQAAIHDFAKRGFERFSKEDDLFIQINDIDYFLVQPSRSPISALSRTTALNRSCLEHFIGKTDYEDIRVSIIEVAEPEGIKARRVSEEDLIEVQRRVAMGEIDVYPYESPLKPEREPDSESPPWEEFGTPRKPLRIILVKRPEGKDLEAAFYSEPIWNASRGAVAVFQLRCQTYYQTGQGQAVVQADDWTARTLGLIAVRRLTHASDMLSKSSPQGLALSVPLSLHALAHSSSRASVMNRLRKIVDNPDHQARLFIELEDIPPDVPMVRVSEAVAQLKGFARRVTVRAPGLKSDMTALARTGADGVILSLAGDFPSPRKLQALKTEIKKAGAFLAVDDAIWPHWADVCHATGVHEVTGKAITEAYGERFVPAPLTLNEILATELDE